jgi:hypothetical protein
VIGLLVPPGDVRRLADEGLALLRDPILRRCMGEQGRGLAGQRFAVEQIVARYGEVYRDLGFDWVCLGSGESADAPPEGQETIPVTEWFGSTCRCSCGRAFVGLQISMLRGKGRQSAARIVHGPCGDRRSLLAGAEHCDHASHGQCVDGKDANSVPDAISE